MSITKNLNLAVLGPKNVGKTTILKKYCTNSYIKTTKGFDLFTHIIRNNFYETKIMFWDIPGDEEFNLSLLSVLHECQGIVLVYDLTISKTFDDLDTYYKSILSIFDDKVKQKPSFLLLGNKSDAVSPNENNYLLNNKVEEWCAKNDIKLNNKVSALSGEGINQSFENFDKSFLLYPMKPPKFHSKIENLKSTQQLTENIEQNGFKFLLLLESKEAKITQIPQNTRSIEIPRSVKYKSNEYIITGFKYSSQFDKSNLYIKFHEDSEIETIDSSMFRFCCCSISRKIKIIVSFAFEFRTDLQQVIFQPNSKLEYIGQKAFHKTGLISIHIPPHVKIISSDTFSCCNQLKSVEFDRDSELKTIEENAFGSSSISSLSIPSSLLNFCTGWCKGTKKLNDIKIIQNHKKNIMNFENKFILGKSNLESDVFDILYFASRDIKSAKIPHFIKKIASYAFENCSKLESVEFPDNSELQIIDTAAFKMTPIKKVAFPPHLTSINTNAFIICSNLCHIEFHPNCELKIIGKGAFSGSSIEKIIFPTHLTSIDEGAFCFCKYLHHIEFHSNCELQIINKYAFNGSPIKKIIFPPHLTKICEGAFLCCDNLTEISQNSALEIIEKKAFCNTSFESFTITPNLIKIDDEAFSECYYLKQVVLAPNSNVQLQSFGSSIFNRSSIEKIEIPSNIQLNEGWCRGTLKLKNIKIVPNGQQNIMYYENKLILGKSNLESDNFDILYFARRDVKTVTIPSFVKKISSYAFDRCQKLTTVQPANDDYSSIEGTFSIPSTIVSLGKYSFNRCCCAKHIVFPSCTNYFQITDGLFSYTSIKEIKIPSSIKEICNCAFAFCNQLEKVVIPFDSKLEVIGSNSFNSTVINEFIIPFNVQKIGDHAFFNCTKLKKVLIPDNSQLVSIGDYAFDFCSFNQFYVPQLIESLPSNLFYKNRDLKIIEIAENTILKMSRNYFRIPSNITWIIVLIPPKVSKRMISNSSAISSFDYLH